MSKTLSNKEILLNLGVAKKEKGGRGLLLNNTGVLFFAKDPQKFFSWSLFTVALFKDKEGADIIDRKEIAGSLFEIVDKVMDFVKLYAKVAYKFTGKPQRENIYEYSFEAIREAVINSVMHKNYFEHGHNNILKFFPDRIQIENVWIKPKYFILGKTVFRRNKTIAALFSRIHFGEKLGSGVERMKEYCKKENAPFPKIDFTDSYFYIVFKPTKSYLEMIKDTKKIEKVGEKVGEILDLISQNNNITYVELSRKVGIAEKSIYMNIEKLKQKELLKRIGPAKGGYWKVIIK